MKNLAERIEQNSQHGWIALNIWLDRLGRSETTGYRWRKRGWLETTVIAGKHYLSAENLANFERRAAAGEFASVTGAGTMQEAAAPGRSGTKCNRPTLKETPL